MTIRKLWHEGIVNDEDVLDFYNVSGELRRLSIDPPLDNSLIQKIKAIKGVGWIGEADYVVVVNVSPAEILIEDSCCDSHYWKLASRILEVLKQEGNVNTNIPSGYLNYP